MRTFLVAILLFAASSANAQQVAPAPKFIRENSPVIALPETRNYPLCKNPFEDAYRARWSLIDKGKFMQFVLKDQSTIRIRR